jgi:hypothetical protein
MRENNNRGAGKARRTPGGGGGGGERFNHLDVGAEVGVEETVARVSSRLDQLPARKAEG